MEKVEIACRGAATAPIEHLEYFQGNLKDLSEENYNKLKKEILALGFSEPISVWKTEGKLKILNGHQRLRVLSQMQKEGVHVPEIPISFVDAKTEKEALRKVLALTSQYGEITSDGLYEFMQKGDIELAEMLENYRFPEIDTEKFQAEYFIDPLVSGCDEDEVPEVDDKEPITKTGDLYILGDHRVLCGDCTDKKNVDKLMGGKKTDMVFTSPPYSDIRDYGGNNIKPETLCKFLNYCSPPIFINLGIKRKDREIIRYWDIYIRKAEENGLKLVGWNVWDKLYDVSLGALSESFTVTHEFVFIFNTGVVPIKKTVPCKTGGMIGLDNGGPSKIRGKDGKFSPRIRPIRVGDKKRAGTVLSLGSDKSHEAKHPAKFSVAFAQHFLDVVAPLVVYDPFLGSGSTLIACEKTKRKCYGMEIDPHYCDVIVARWEKYSDKKAEKQT